MENEKRLEEGLRGVRLHRPPAHVRGELMLKARRELRGQRRLRRVTWVLVAAAVLLLAVNMLAAHMYCSAIPPPCDGTGAADSIELVPTSSEAIRLRYDAITNTRAPNGDRAAAGE